MSLVESSVVYFDHAYIDATPLVRTIEQSSLYPWGTYTPASNIVYFDSPYLNDWAPSHIAPPYPYEVSIAGHSYVIDTSFEPYRRDAFRHRSIPPQRESINLDNIAGEGTVDTQGLWRRGQIDWSLGAGQQFLDRKGGESNRFYRSKGVNPWVQWQLTLLNDTQKVVDWGERLFIRSIGVQNYAYILANDVLYWTQNWSTFTGVSGMPGNMNGIATDGENIYVSSPSGVYSTVAGSTSGALMVSGSYDSVGYANERLLASSGPTLYSLSTTAATTLLTHVNPNWIWTAYAGGSSQIYIGGRANVGGGINSSQAGGGSNIYRTTLDADGTTLMTPVVALPLEGGEFCTALGTYLNFIFVGTNYGLRMCQTLAAYDPTGNQGDLRAGPLIPNITQPVTLPVTGFVGNGRYVYFSWGDYDAESTGIGRLDLTSFIDALAPAYASDLMIPGDGPVYLDWDPITEGPLMARQGDGTTDNPASIWTLKPGYAVPEGSVESGQIWYDIPDDKVAMELDTRALAPYFGSWQGWIALDANWSQNYRLVGASTYHNGEGYWALPQLRAELFQVKLVLTASTGAQGQGIAGQGPTLTRWTLKAFPAIATGIEISCVLLLSRVDTEKGMYRPFDPYAEYAFLENLRQRQQVITYVEGPFAKDVLITSLDWLPNLEQNNGNRSGFQSDLIVYMKTLETEVRNI
jgi:hypothetical protein